LSSDTNSWKELSLDKAKLSNMFGLENKICFLCLPVSMFETQFSKEGFNLGKIRC